MTSIKRALLSVSNKEGLVPLAGALRERGVEIVSTGGTATLLGNEGIAVTPIDAVTGFPEMLGGRVRTLHPNVFGGILGRRSHATDPKEMAQHGIRPIDLVVVNFYPFEETVRSGGDRQSIIEKIDIGGPSLVRAAAKSHEDVLVLHDPAQYPEFLDRLTGEDTRGFDNEYRASLAAGAFAAVTRYDRAISGWFAGDEAIALSARLRQTLRYGENPHQTAGWYEDDGARLSLTPLQGKELSYNNLLDGDAAWELVEEWDEPAVAIIKHGNPCGAAVGVSHVGAYEKALACDPVSAFGGVVAVNGPVDGALAELLAKHFLEVVLAHSFTDDAEARLGRKKKLRLVQVTSKSPSEAGGRRVTIRTIGAGYLAQDPDRAKQTREEWTVPTKRKPTPGEWRDLETAWKVAKHVRSNAIVFVKDGATLGIGAGQMSRVDSAELAVRKGRGAGHDLTNSAVASDGFFPFADGVEQAAGGGAAAVIQPGGSIRDQEVIDAADRLGVAMVFTGMRHFRH
ncbi:MAG: bifunctional phosphoribosylaminoimidazolecarboxamide formyltransferase/IMP cyclohydrolase [Gemmatimonadetes bacterium]|nr:bifunctional phosphoribosylaminoimidazolecarboxamide formyltransferase/IMP cyclohydrolase [Gemmatimonadota bacterium]